MLTAAFLQPHRGTVLTVTIALTLAVALRALAAHHTGQPRQRETAAAAVVGTAAMCVAWQTWIVALVVCSFLVTLNPVIGPEPGPVLFVVQMIGGALVLLASIALLRDAVGLV